ncbi:hypothetical protein TNIN_531 [Trichonephila inaurata madagascariensis]|uniref:Uncharacterized protein n=1 Tax=Trichonephila inaurata madagascariensis TaxID=2747483 RepID=A0A8X7BQW0_9ARAC|nr:hypothetical protein TNIN_531 [Trichonephila inaurata madagascariensis]
MQRKRPPLIRPVIHTNQRDAPHHLPLCTQVYYIPARIAPERLSAGTIALVRAKKRIAAAAKWQLDCLRPVLDSHSLSLLLHNGVLTVQSISAPGRGRTPEFRLWDLSRVCCKDVKVCW